MKQRQNYYLNELINCSKRDAKLLLEQDNNMEVRMKIMDFLKKNPNPPDEEMHEFAKELGMEPDELETQVYAVLTTMLKTGRHQDVPDSKYDQKELEEGQIIEKEHTDCPILAKEIAKDHLSEYPDYYTRLKKMEEEAKKFWNDKRKSQ